MCRLLHIDDEHCHVEYNMIAGVEHHIKTDEKKRQPEKTRSRYMENEYYIIIIGNGMGRHETKARRVEEKGISGR